jgi:hypothetical protein
MDMSLREKSTWLSLVSTLGLFGYYFYNIMALSGLPENDALNIALDLSIDIITAAVMIEILFQSLLAVSNHREAALGNDERDKLFNYRSASIAYYVLICGVFLTLGRIVILEYNPTLNASESSWQIPLLTAHILLLSFILAEVSRFAALIFFYRRAC